jgi:serine protease
VSRPALHRRGRTLTGLGLLALLVAPRPGSAMPRRVAALRPSALAWSPGQDPTRLQVKLREGQRPRSSTELALAGARPLFPRDPIALAADRETFDPEHRLADLRAWLVLTDERAEAAGGPSLTVRAEALLQDPAVEWLGFAPAPVEPPIDLSPTTPDFSDLQGYLGPAPDGLGVDEAHRWPGGRGEAVTILDVEYGWEPDHEDLDAAPEESAVGWDSLLYAFHGTSVLGMLVAGDDGFGVTGIAPAAGVLMASPYDDTDTYNLAAVIEEAASLLEAGDVLLIEQQIYALGTYAPVEADPAIWDAISHAVARGVHVVEPAANGGLDLDDPAWGGWFDRSIRDSGAILVGGGGSPDGGWTPRAAWPSGSSTGSRVDLQGWYDGITTATNADNNGYYADLYLPDGDGRQAYTASFGGTSGASPMVVGVVALASSISRTVWGAPWDPLDLRDALVSTGTPQAGAAHIGPQPDLRRLLRTWALR